MNADGASGRARGGRGQRSSSNLVADMRRRGFDDDGIRAELRAMGFSAKKKHNVDRPITKSWKSLLNLVLTLAATSEQVCSSPGLL